MGNAGSIEMERVGSFLQITDEDGQVKRVLRSAADGVSTFPIKHLSVKLDDIVTVSQTLNDNDVTITLKNGVEYLLDELEDPDEVYRQVCKKIYADEDD